jgi:hypothetical protein
VSLTLFIYFNRSAVKNSAHKLKAQKFSRVRKSFYSYNKNYFFDTNFFEFEDKLYFFLIAYKPQHIVIYPKFVSAISVLHECQISVLIVELSK